MCGLNDEYKCVNNIYEREADSDILQNNSKNDIVYKVNNN